MESQERNSDGRRLFQDWEIKPTRLERIWEGMTEMLLWGLDPLEALAMSLFQLPRARLAFGAILVLGVATVALDDFLEIEPHAKGRRNETMLDKYFSDNYITARTRFRKAVQRAGARLMILELDAKGPGGETLTIDIGWIGNPSPRRVLLHSSGLHGVEGFAGSAVQLQFLEHLPILPPDGAIALVHSLNPYGMAWLRRVNENNVDLNRNFLAGSVPYSGAPGGYQELDSFLNPSSPPSSDFFFLRAGWLVLRHGLATLRQTTAGGQYDYPKGLFFGGRRLEQGPHLYQDFSRQHLNTAKLVAVIDVHTGLGPFGQDALLVTEGDYPEMHNSLGAHVQLRDTLGVAYETTGGHYSMFPRVLPNARVKFVCQEFGTYHSIRVLHALRGENRWHHFGGGSVDHPTKTSLMEAFYPEDRNWRKSVLRRGAELIDQFLVMIFSPSIPVQ